MRGSEDVVLLRTCAARDTWHPDIQNALGTMWDQGRNPNGLCFTQCALQCMFSRVPALESNTVSSPFHLSLPLMVPSSPWSQYPLYLGQALWAGKTSSPSSTACKLSWLGHCMIREPRRRVGKGQACTSAVRA